jgi:general secretion pathway protein A
MYEKFFQLERTPFSTVPNPDCVYFAGQHADAIGGLVFGVLSRKGYLVLTGEAGLGKTTALGAMAHLMGKSSVQTSLILNPILTGPEFLEMALLNFGFKDIPLSKAMRLKIFQDFLIRSDADGKVTALVIDEAHKLSTELLEEVRLLGNFEASDHKLLQMVLVGQPELNDRLNLPELWQLKQRIAIRMSLARMDRETVEHYLIFRWSKAGATSAIPFTDAAIDAIATWSKGIPRLINAICDNALLIAFSEETRTVEMRHVREACKELDLAISALRPRFDSVSPGPTAQTTLPRESVVPGPVEREVPQQPPAGANNADPHLWMEERPSLLKRWIGMGDKEKE